MPIHPSRATALFLSLVPAASAAQQQQQQGTGASEILVIGAAEDNDPPATRAAVTAAQIATTINAVNVEDTIRYLPGLVVRKRHIGDTQAPLATRTSGLGSSARSLIFADGALLSSLIGNNNTFASPRWGMVSPVEIERIDVLYGPYSAAYAGNAVGAVVNIVTRLPEGLEATLITGTSVQTFDQYATHASLPSYQVAATLGDRIGPLALFGSITRTTSNSQPLAYVTASLPAAPSTAGMPTTGGFDDVNRTGQPIRVLGASGFEHQVQDTIKLKAALDLSSALRLTYVAGLFRDAADSTVRSYLTAYGQPAYASQLNIAGYAYTVAPAAFGGGVYRIDQRHWSHALSLGGTSTALEWDVIGTIYDFAKDSQRSPTTALPSGFAGGAGTITRLDGTGWQTLDAKAAWRTKTNVLSAGAHLDRFALASNRYATDDWRNGAQGALNQASRGKTRTTALWIQDGLTIVPPLTLTLGARYEWWRAYDGFNYSAAPVLAPTAQPTRIAHNLSPKAALAYTVAPGWTARLSIGKAYRFPTVGELYQAITTGLVQTVPDPDLRPERALSEELALERRDARGSVRVSLFNEVIDDALISQSAPLVAGSSIPYTYVQNVDRTRARGVELAAQCTGFPSADFDLSASVTYADATTRKNGAFPAAVGKLLPSVPRWKASGVATWRPIDPVSLTAAARFASRNYGTLDNSDVVADTYQGFSGYFVVDLRAAFRITTRYQFAIGVDNVNNDRYYLFHPFPQRTVHADVTLTL